RIAAKAVFVVTCLIISFYQTFLVSQIYFNYPTTVLIDVLRLPIIAVPGFTVCTQIVPIVSRKLVMHKYPQITDEIMQKISKTASESVKEMWPENPFTKYFHMSK